MNGFFGCWCGAKDREEHEIRNAAEVGNGYLGHPFADKLYWVSWPEEGPTVSYIGGTDQKPKDEKREDEK